MIVVLSTIVNELAVVPPKDTLYTLEKLSPLIVMVLPIEPESGEADVMTKPVYVNPGNESLLIELLIETAPDIPAAITALIWVEEMILNDDAGTPPKKTLFTLERLFPVIVIVVPIVPELG